MKKLFVAVAAMAAGMTVFAAYGAERGGDRPVVKAASATFAFTADCPLLGCSAAKTAPAKTASAAVRAQKPAAAMRKRAPASGAAKAAGKVPKAARAESRKKPAPALDKIETASIPPHTSPVLVATARQSVVGDPLPGVRENPLALAALSTPPISAGTVRYGAIVSRYATSFGVPVSLAHAVISVESNYRVDTLGSAGEIGLMQIKPATARLMGYTGSIAGLYDPDANLKFGIKYLAMAHRLSGGTICGTILKYNAGHAATRMNPISAAYCSKVMRRLAGV